MPGLATVAEMGPPRTECGVGGLMPWADKLWMISYNSSNIGSGLGMGLHEIDENLRMKKRPESIAGTYANRMVHHPSNQMIMGPHFIDEKRKVRTCKGLLPYRLGGTMEHLDDPENKVLVLGMEGHLLEVDVKSLKARQIFDLNKELKLSGRSQPHFKAGFTNLDRVIVANNSYSQQTFEGGTNDGRLAEWDGNSWRTLDRNPYNEVFGRKRLGNVVFATGWDRASAILKVCVGGKWSEYRLPKASHTFDHFWATEWPRIRELEHERFLMDCHGMFYELPIHAFGGKVWGVKPVCAHLWAIPDFCAYRGLLVLGTDQETPGGSSNVLAAQPQSGVWMGKAEDLWSWGKPSGWGGPWWKEKVKAGQTSPPYLMTGFDKKCLHLSHDAKGSVNFTVEVDFLGDGSWMKYGSLSVGSKGYEHHEFPAGFSAHWVRVRVPRACRASAYFVYT